MQATGAATKVFQRTAPLLPLVSMCESPLLRLSWCHFGQAESPYCGGGGGGGAAVKVMLTGTLTLPAAPASKTSCEVRVPEVACAATFTVTDVLAPAASVPCAAESVTAASSEVADQDRSCPPSLST